MPRLPALYLPKNKWRLASQTDPLYYLEENQDSDGTWRRNCVAVVELADKVVEVLDHQSSRGQALKLSEKDAKQRFPNSVVASLGAIRKGKPHGVVSERMVSPSTLGLGSRTLNGRRLLETFDARESDCQGRLALTRMPSSTHYSLTRSASASYYWSRVDSALGRLSHFFAGDSARTWHMWVADDYHLMPWGQTIGTLF